MEVRLFTVYFMKAEYIDFSLLLVSTNTCKQHKHNFPFTFLLCKD